MHNLDQILLTLVPQATTSAPDASIAFPTLLRSAGSPYFRSRIAIGAN